jgi:DNA ligase-1
MNCDPAFRVIADLERHPSRLNKEAIIEAQAQAGNTEFFAGCRLAMDPMVTFGVKQVDEKTDTDGPGLSWDNFSLIVAGLVNRTLTGNLARDTIQQMMTTATRAEWNGWYRRILIKDLRCGVSEKTINKVVGKKYVDYAIPVFGCQLAHDSQNHDTKVCGRKLLEVKLDGVRVITILYPGGRVDQFSRNGKELVNFEHIKQQIGTTADHFAEPWVLDGEVMSSSFQDLMRQVHRKENVVAGDAVLHLFDMLPLSAFEAGEYSVPQTARTSQLREWYDRHQHLLPNVQVLEQEYVNLDTESGQQTYADVNRRAIAGGYEGIMIKDPEAGYECKRSTSWLKLKPFIEVTLEVIDVEEGTGRNSGRLGALVCRGLDDGKTIQVNVGSGFSDSDRTDFWDNRHSLLGQLVEVRADSVTRNQDGTYSLRFPRYKTFRGFVAGEKL